MRLRRVLAVAAVMLGLLVVGTGCIPEPPGPPPTYRSDECPVAIIIEDVFKDTGDWRHMVDIAMRESRCEPCAYYPSRVNCDADPRTARGVFQLLGHRDLELAAAGHGNCVYGWWSDPWCNIVAARFLYDQAGRSPWRASGG